MNLDKFDQYFCIGAKEDTGWTSIYANGDLDGLTACIAILTEYLSEQFDIDWQEVLDVVRQMLKEAPNCNEPHLLR